MRVKCKLLCKDSEVPRDSPHQSFSKTDSSYSTNVFYFYSYLLVEFDTLAMTMFHAVLGILTDCQIHSLNLRIENVSPWDGFLLSFSVKSYIKTQPKRCPFVVACPYP